MNRTDELMDIEVEMGEQTEIDDGTQHVYIIN